MTAVDDALEQLADERPGVALDRLRRRTSVTGQRLAPKQDTSKPLGTSSRGGLPALLRRATKSVSAEGYVITYHPTVGKFQDGDTPGEPRRRILGLSLEEKESHAEVLLAALIEDARTLGIARR